MALEAIAHDTGSCNKQERKKEKIYIPSQAKKLAFGGLLLGFVVACWSRSVSMYVIIPVAKSAVPIVTPLSIWSG